MASRRHASGRSQRWLTWWVGAGVLAFVGFTIGPSLAGRNVLASVDALTTRYPWLAGGSQALGHQMCSGDTIDAGLPGIAYIRNQLFAGHLPNWQSLVAGGSPLGSQPNLGLLNPISWPYFFMPLWLAPAFVKLAGFVVAIGGTYLFLRRHQVRRAAGLLAGVTFAASGFLVMWTNWPQTAVAAFIPALFWATERLVQRARLTDVVPLAIVVAAMLLGGFPAVTGWALYAAAAYLLVRVIAAHRHEARQLWRRIAIGVGGVAIGFLLSMVQMLPFAAAYTSSDFSYRASLGHVPQPLSGLLTLFVPDAAGLCIAGKPVYGNVNPVELVAYIGSAALVLVVVGAIARRGTERLTRGTRGYLAIAAAVVLFLGWGTTVVLEIVDVLPVFSGNPIGRIRSVLGFLLAALVGFGFDALQRRLAAARGARAARESEQQRPVRHRAWQLLVIASVLGLAAGVGYYANQQAVMGGYRHALVRHMATPSLLLVGALICVGLVYLRWRPAAMLALAVIPGLVVWQGVVFFRAVLPGDAKANFYPVTPTHQFLQDNLGADRYAASGGVMYPATSLYYGLRSATGHTFQERAWIEMLMAVDSGVMLSPTHSEFDAGLTPDLAAHSDILDRMGVKYFVVGPSVLVGDMLPLAPGPGSVTGTPAAPATCTLAPGPLRGVTVELARTLYATDAARGLTLNVTASAGGTTVSSGRFLGAGVPAGVPISIAAAGEGLPAGQPVTVRVWASDAQASLELVAGRGGSAAGAACAPVRPTDDGLKVAFADAGSIVYQRLSALPRVRWVSKATVIADPTARLLALIRGDVPDDEVVLDAPGPATSGAPATIDVRSDAGGRITADVDAAGAGYLVVADALQQPGWSVTLDGKHTDLVAADHAMGAVAIPAGVHHVSFSYHAPGQLAGVGLTGVGIVLLIGAAVVDRRRWFTPKQAVGEGVLAPEQEPAPSS